MSLSGLCQICESATAEHTCTQCGTQVCEKHYDRAHGACVSCAAVLDEESVDTDGQFDESEDGTDDTGPGTEMQ